MPNIIPTRSAYLELREDRRGMREGYRFLDEKRLVLAGELMRQLAAYRQAKAAFDTQYRQATGALRAALRRHGLEELQLYPAQQAPEARTSVQQRRVLGVLLQTAQRDSGDILSPAAVFASPEAEHCRQSFQRLLDAATSTATLSGNLQRLWNEYSATSRRARALEDILLPEMDADLAGIDSALEEQDREEAVRVRHFRR